MEGAPQSSVSGIERPGQVQHDPRSTRLDLDGSSRRSRGCPGESAHRSSFSLSLILRWHAADSSTPVRIGSRQNHDHRFMASCRTNMIPHEDGGGEGGL